MTVVCRSLLGRDLGQPELVDHDAVLVGVDVDGVGAGLAVGGVGRRDLVQVGGIVVQSDVVA